MPTGTPVDASWSDSEFFNGAAASAFGGGINACITDIGTLETAKQTLNANLTQISGLTLVNDNVVQIKGGVITSRTIAQLKTDLGTFNQDTTGSAAKWNGITLSGSPTAGQVPTFVSGTAATWQTPTTGGGGGGGFTLTDDGTGLFVLTTGGTNTLTDDGTGLFILG